MFTKLTSFSLPNGTQTFIVRKKPQHFRHFVSKCKQQDTNISFRIFMGIIMSYLLRLSHKQYEKIGIMKKMMPTHFPRHTVSVTDNIFILTRQVTKNKRGFFYGRTANGNVFPFSFAFDCFNFRISYP